MNMHDQLRAAMEAAQKLQMQEAAIDRAVATEPLVTVADDEPAVSLDDEPTVVAPRIADPAPRVADFSNEPVEQTVNTLTRSELKIKGLDEKAVLVQVKRRMYSPYKLDEAESHAYGAGNVNKHLFEGRQNRVKEAISKYTAVYSYVKDNTVPWSTGVDMLNIDHYFEFTNALRTLIADAEAAVDDLCANWDYEVQADMHRLAQIALAKGKPNIVNPNDYPTAEELRGKFGIEVRYMPVPTTGDFRVQISDEDKASLQKQLQDAEDNASKHVISQLLEPMRRAVEKLTVPIGDDGSIFRDSLIDNLVDVSSRMAKVNVSDDPVISERIKDLQSLIGTYANNKDVLREMPTVREKAAKQIDDLMSKMAGLV